MFSLFCADHKITFIDQLPEISLCRREAVTTEQPYDQRTLAVKIRPSSLEVSLAAEVSSCLHTTLD